MLYKLRKVVKTLEQASLFDNMKFCAICHRSLPDTFEGDLCPACQENHLFSEVKEYIRSRDVTEYQVAEHFNIPRLLVKKWIAEGRIEYKEQEEKIVNLHCNMCGAEITFGTLCQKCYREKYHTATGYVPLQLSGEKHKMRFLEKDNSDSEN